MTSKVTYKIHSIQEIDDEVLKQLSTLLDKDCQPGKYSLIELRDLFKAKTDILYGKQNDILINVILIDVFPKHKSVYLHDVCVANSHRGQGIFNKGLQFLIKHYKTKGIKTITLDASDSTKEKGLNQKARIAIFSKSGFSINPTTDIWKENGEFDIVPTAVELNTGEVVELQDDSYTVKDKSQKEYTIRIDQIERCKALGSYVSCPMKMNIPTNGGKTKKSSLMRRRKRQHHRTLRMLTNRS